MLVSGGVVVYCSAVGYADGRALPLLWLAQIAKMIAQHPRVLVAQVDDHLLPLLDYLHVSHPLLGFGSWVAPV